MLNFQQILGMLKDYQVSSMSSKDLHTLPALGFGRKGES